MARIIKHEPLPHAVICDTNILWFEDKGPIANPEFERFWDVASKEFDLELHIPETVRGELIFQHFTSCQKLFKSTEENVRKISTITGNTHSTRLNLPMMRRQIEVKFDKWIKAKRGHVIPVPIERIGWKRLVDDAVWRLPPFIADPKNPDFEKGFRDALIMETLCDLVGTESRKINFAFLCNDSTLREATVSRLKAELRFSAYETIKDFESYLRLTKEKLTNDFISRIVVKAKARFFNRDDPSCLALRDRLVDQIQADFKDYFLDIAKSEKDSILSFDPEPDSASWNPVGSGGFWIENPQFLRIETRKRYFWKSIIKFVRLYTRSATTLREILGASSASGLDERILILPFHVTWSAMVKNDARFHDIKTESIEIEGNEFRLSTESEVKHFRLKAEPPAPTGGGGAAPTA